MIPPVVVVPGSRWAAHITCTMTLAMCHIKMSFIGTVPPNPTFLCTLGSMQFSSSSGSIPIESLEFSQPFLSVPIAMCSAIVPCYIIWTVFPSVIHCQCEPDANLVANYSQITRVHVHLMYTCDSLLIAILTLLCLTMKVNHLATGNNILLNHRC